jgi:hypothetical protein
MASQYRNVKFENNYAPLKLYNPSMGVPITSFLEKNMGVQVVSNFKGFDYTNPNYNTLVSDSMSNYPTVTKGYQQFCPKDCNDCVKYEMKPVPCNTSGGGGSGPKGPVNFRM